MKKVFTYILFAIFCVQGASAVAQTQSEQHVKQVFEKPYDPTEDAQAKIDALLDVAKKENKNILIQAGGNWCIWCLMFNNFVKTTPDVKAVLDANYLYYHLNYSPENKNEAVFAKYAPEGGKLGYPFFIVLSPDGEVLKVRESGNLEEGRGYNKEKVLAFFNAFKPTAG